MSREVELKFLLAPDALRDLRQSSWFKEAEGSAKVEELVSVYFDTPRFKLRNRGISLRVRRDGEKRLQTIKSGFGAQFVRDEWNGEIASDVPDLSQAKKTVLAPLATKKLERKLTPLFETKVERTLVPLQTNGSQIELVIDRGQIQSGERSEDISEVELELKSGKCEAMIEVIRVLADVFPLRYGVKSKAERGYLLTQGEMSNPVRSEPISLEGVTMAGEGFKRIGFACLRHIALNEAGVLDQGAESVHQMRIGLRRLRAAISLFKDLLQDPESANIKSELKWLTDQLGPAREFDAFLNESGALKCEAEYHERQLKTLESVLNQQRAAALDSARTVAMSNRYQRIVLDTALWLTGGVWWTSTDELQELRREQPLRKLADKILTQRVRKAVRRIKKVEQLQERQRHELRISVKKLHYGMEFFATLYSRKNSVRKDHIKVLKSLQDSLGVLNDNAAHERVASKLCEQEQTPTGESASREAIYAIGLVRGREDSDAKRLLTAVRKGGAKLGRLPHFWR